MKALKLRVLGRVQRVGFRRYALDIAQELKLSGTIKNLPDGSVEIFIQGSEGEIKEFINRIREAPLAKIRDIEIYEESVNPELKYFKIIYGALEEELQEGFGAMQNIFMEYWREFRDYRQEFRDYRQEFKDYREEFRDYRQEFRDFARRTDENFQKLMEKYGEISEKLTVILNTLIEESRKTTKLLETIQRESKETREQLTKAMERLTKVVEKFLEK